MKRESKVFVTFILIAMLLGTAILSQTSMFQTYMAERKLKASYAQVQTGEDAVEGTDYVKFDAFILEGGKQYRGVAKELNQTAELYLNLNVLTNGRLENGRIVVENTRNFGIKNTVTTDDILVGIYNGTYQLNTVQNGTFKSIPLVIEQNVSNKGNWTSTIQNLSKNNTITLTGTHVAEDGTRTNISKTVHVQVDWYGSKNLDRMQSKERSCIVNSSTRKVLIGFTTELWAQSPTDTVYQVPDKAAVLTGTMPKLSGYAPIAVQVTSSSVNEKNLTYNYNQATRELTIRAETIPQEGIVEEIVYDKRYKFNITLEYPYEAYQSLSTSTNSINVTVRGYLEGYNNPNLSYANPAISGTASNTVNINLRNPIGDIILYSAETSLLEKANSRVMYDRGVNLETGYVTDWIVNLNEQDNIQKLLFTDEYSTVEDKEYSAYQYNGDYFQSNSGNFFPMADFVTYTGVKLDNNAKDVLGESGYIIIYNADTNQEIKRVSITEAGTYIPYDAAVKRIRIETSKPVGLGQIVIRNYKKIENSILVNTYTKDQFTNFSKVYSGLHGYLQKEGSTQNTTCGGDIGVADYTEGNTAFYTEPKMSLNTQYVNQKNFLVQLRKLSYTHDRDMVTWLNPVIFIEFPQEIRDIEITKITSRNNEIHVTNYTIEQIGNKKVAKIYTEGLTTEDENVYVQMNILVDENTTAKTGSIRTFAHNALCDEWKWVYSNTKKETDTYDINQNGNTSEERYTNYTTIDYATPTGLITRTTGSHFNQAGDTIIGPQVGKVEKTDAGRVATVGMDIFNNYNSNLSNVKLVGKIPFAGNTYQLNTGKLGSNFTATMTSSGISLPSNLASGATIYYSYNENTTQDIGDTNNGWTTTPADWSKVRTYLIDFGSFRMPVGGKYTLSYQVQFPSTFNYGNVSYATHALYFDVNQTSGTIAAQTETNKVGFSVVPDRTYTLELTKLQTGTNTTIPNVRYKITGPGVDENGVTYVTGSNGKISISNLFPEETYTLEETYAPTEYIKNTQPIQIQGYIENGQLKIRVLEGTIKGAAVVSNATADNPLVKIEVENQAKYTLNITKYKQGTTTTIPGVRFHIMGEGLPTAGRIVETDGNGKVSITGLYPNQTYTMQEISTPTDYVLDTTPIVFQVNESANTLSMQVKSGTFKQTPTIHQETRTIETQIENITGYNLEITKYKIGTTETIEGVHFSIKEKGATEASNMQATNANGKAIFGGLAPEKSYVLEEIRTTQDYMLNTTPIVFHINKVEGKFVWVLEEGTVKQSRIEQETEEAIATVHLSLENESKYNIELTKYETGTSTTLANINFLIKGKGMAAEGSTYTTNSRGVLTIQRLELNEVYTLKETYAKGYYVDGTEATLQVTRVNGNLQVTYNGRTAKQTPTITQEANSLPVVHLAFNNVNIPKYTVELTKIGEKTGKALEGAKFEITGAGRDLTSEKNYITASNGILTIPNLYENEEYTLTEKLAPAGYKLSETPVKFRATQTSGVWTFQVTSGSFKTTPTVSGNIIKVAWEDELLFKLEKKDQTTGEPLAGAKFTIKDLNGNDAKDVAGNLVGTAETINGTSMRVLTTDANGMIATELAPGLYQATEVQAPFGYNLPAQTTQYFGLDTAREEKREYKPTWGETLGNTYIDNIYSVETCNDGGWIAVGEHAKDLTVNNGTTVPAIVYNGSDENHTGMIIKYNKNGRVEWIDNFMSGLFSGINDIHQTKDGGYIATGYYYTNVTLKNGQTFAPAHGYDGIIIKYNANGTIAWAKVAKKGGQSLTAELLFNKIKETNDGGYIVGGEMYAITSNSYKSIILANGQIITTNGSRDGVIIKYDKNGNMQWARTYGGTDIDHLYDVAQIANGKYVVGGSFSETITLNNGQTLTSAGQTDALSILYSSTGNVEWAERIGVSSQYEHVNTVCATADGGWIAGVYCGYNTSQSINKYDQNGTKQWEKPIKVKVSQIRQMLDGGYLIGGSFSGTLTLDNGITVTGKSTDGIVMRTDNRGSTLWATNVGGTRTEEIESVNISKDGTYYIAGGSTTSTNLELFDGTTISTHPGGSYPRDDGLVVKFEEKVTAAAIPQKQELTFTDSKKSYNITTAVSGSGGSISGQGQSPYESVLYKGTSTKDITATPNAGYAVSKITVNGAEIAFTRKADGSATLNKFTNMSENKHVVVTFTANPADVIVHHYKEGTTEKVAPDETIYGETGKAYTTNAKTNIPKYTVVTSKLPANASGTMSAGTTVVTYYYNLKNTQVLVHHYKDGTTERVAPDETINGKVDQAYTTAGKTIQGYKIVTEKLPANANGTMTEATIEVTYFYKQLQDSKVITHHYLDGTVYPLAPDEETTGRVGASYHTSSKEIEGYDLVESKLPANANGVYREDTTIEVIYYYTQREVHITTAVQGTGGTISGQNQTPYETVRYGENSIKDIIITPNANYRVKKITINGLETSYIENIDKTVYMPQFENMTEDKHVVVSFEKISGGTVTVKYLEYGTEEELAPSETITGNCGDPYTTTRKNIPNYEPQGSDPSNKEGTILEEEQEVIYYYIRSTGTVTIRYLEQGTNQEIAQQELLGGYVGENYTTIPLIKDIENYALVSETVENQTGTYRKGNITVIYYYQKLPATVIVQYLEKGTNTVLAAQEELNGNSGETYDVTDQQKAIKGYKRTADIPSNITGIMTTAENIIVIFYYERETPKTETTITKTGTDKITNKTQEVTYNLDYQTIVDKYLGNATVTITDTLPFKIDQTKSNLAGGTYNETNQTITWTQTIENIDTFENGPRTIHITKQIVVVYQGIQGTDRNMTNKVKGTLNLATTGTKEEKETTKDTEIEIKGNVVVHHYIKNTTTKLSADVVQTDYVGNRYTSRVALDIPANYQVAQRPANETITIVEGTTELIYYYELKEAHITDSTISKIGTDKITDKVQPVNYTIRYTAAVDTYIGNAVVTIVDTLPYAIDVTKSTLNGGTYKEETKTITWKDTIENINTFTNGAKAINVTKNIQVVYKGIHPTTRNMTNKVHGSLELPTNGIKDEKETTKDTAIEIKGNVVVHHYIKNTTTKLSNDVTLSDLVGNTYTSTVATDIPANYKLAERPTAETVTIVEGTTTLTYYYELKEREITNTAISKNGTNKITDKKEVVNYQIHYTGKVNSYIGTIQVTIVDTLPYPIEEAKSNLAGGTYDSGKQTITWIETYEVDTFANGAKEIDITKEISLVFQGIDPTTRNMTNKVNGILKLLDTGDTDNKVATKDTEIEIRGKVIVHHYIKDTTTKLSADVTATPLVGTEYTSVAATNIPANYQLFQTPENETITIVEGNTELIYYYEMKDSSITDTTITKTGTDKIIEKTQEVEYTVQYHTVVDSYIGNAKVTITDTLPYAIDTRQSYIAGGTYNEATKTITWEDNIQGIDTFKNGAKTIDITKHIMVVYQSVGTNSILPTDRNMTNKVHGKIELPVTKDSDEAETTKDTEIEIKGNVIVHHYIKDTTIKLAEDVTARDLVGNTYTSTESEGIPANYQVCKRPENETITIVEGTTELIYYYEMKDSSIIDTTITKNGTDKIINTAQEVNYTVQYHTVVDSYIGIAKVTIIDTLPYAIDTRQSYLAGGIYDEATRTITWEETIEGINTFTNGAKTIDIAKRIMVVYQSETTNGMFSTDRIMTNKVKGKIELPTTLDSKEVEATKDTIIEIKGTVIVHYYKLGTITKLSKDVTVTDLVGNTVIAQPATDISANYELVKRPTSEMVTIAEGITELIYYYQMKDSSIPESSITKEGTSKITDKSQPVDYDIHYHAVVESYLGTADVTITDALPYAIDETKSTLDGGTYNEEAKTITWKEAIEGIDTFANGTKTIDITKHIKLVYQSAAPNGMLPTDRNMINTVNGTLELLETGGKDETEDTKETIIEIKGNVLVHHYIKDTTTKISNDVTESDLVGRTYTATPATDIPINYEVVQRPEAETITITEGTTEVIYYYDLKERDITETAITKTGTDKITNTNEVVHYQMHYTAKVDSYIGTATVTIVDTLPYPIEETKSNLAGGTYDSGKQTITWIETYEVDTFANGAKEIDIQKQISVVYQSASVGENTNLPRSNGIRPTDRIITNKVNGILKLVDTGDTDNKVATKDTEIEIKGNVIVHHYIQGTTNKLSEDVHAEKLVGTPYTATPAADIPANYQLVTRPDQETITIAEGTTTLIYYYKLKEVDIIEPTIVKEGTDRITSLDQTVSYTVTYNTTIDSYLGTAKVTIVDTLPYAMDVSKSDINGGTYNEETNTITWEDTIENIDTFENGPQEISISKQLNIVFKGMPTTVRSIINHATGKLELPTTKDEDTQETDKETKVEIPGKIIVHHYAEGTTTPVAPGSEINGLVGEEYTTSSATEADLTEGYELSKIPENSKRKLAKRRSRSHLRIQTKTIYYHN